MAGVTCQSRRQVLVLGIIVGIACEPPAPAQYATGWQTKAGGKLAFEAASVKPSKGAFVPSNVPLTPWDDQSAPNGLLRADASLLALVQFAYKLWPMELQRREFSRLPKWVAADRYFIEARAASGNPTKDQMRLMMQSLLAERFQLAAHFEASEVAVLELRLAKAGQPGPKLIPHANGPPCDKPGASPGDGLPGFTNCRSLSAIDQPGNTRVLGSRDVTMDMLAGVLSMISLGLDRPLIDKTGLTGTFDFTLEWTREVRGAAADSPAPLAAVGPTVIDALRDQLGLKLDPAKATLPILVVDRVERPSEN